MSNLPRIPMSRLSAYSLLMLGLVLAASPARSQDSKTAPDSMSPPASTVHGIRPIQTSKSAKLLSNDGPNYPEILRRVGVQGEVRVQFTVDTSGKADLSSLNILAVIVDMSLMREWTARSANNKDPDEIDEMAAKVAFTESAKRSIANMTFSPAEADGARVRQLVELPFEFKLNH